MGQYDFNKFLKHYVYIFDIKNYDDHTDKIFLEKVFEILNTLYNKKIYEPVILPSSTGSTTFHNVYVCYDIKESDWDERKIISTINNILITLGVKS